MSYVNQIGKEATTALLVLAMVFLSFSQHQPTTNYDSASVDAYQVAVLSFCGGNPSGDHHGTNGPCHACRSAIADLPPPPCDFVPAYTKFHTVGFAIKSDAPRASASVDGYRSRAPPVSA